jgi:hypothetical protein
MKKVVNQMMGCLNVLSRLKNPGIRIIPPVIHESFVGNSALLTTHIFSRHFFGSPLRQVERPKPEVPHSTTVTLSLLHFLCWSILNSSADFGCGQAAGYLG